MSNDDQYPGKRRGSWKWIFLLPLALLPILTIVPLVIPGAVERPDGPLPANAKTSPAASYATIVDEARTLARAYATDGNLPSLSVAVGVDDDVVWAEAIGWADLEKRVPATPANQFRIGSISKTLTSVAVGLLYERGRIDLDASVRRYVPSFPEKQWPVTTRQLMGHVAGIRHPRSEGETMPTRHCEDVKEGIEIFANDPLRFEPGTAYRFSTYGWILVSAAVEAAARQPFDEVLQREVFAPAGMTHTVPDRAKDQMPDRASLYFPRMFEMPKLGLDPATFVDYACFSGAGVYLSTPTDLVRFGLAVMNGRLLKPETTQMLQTSLKLPSGEETGYGLGWDIEAVPSGTTAPPMRGVGHDGNPFGATGMLLTFPDRRIVVALLSNVTYAQLEPLAGRIGALFAARRQG